MASPQDNSGSDDPRPDEPLDTPPPATPIGDPRRATYLDGLSAKQEAVIFAMLTEPTLAKAAAKAGITDRTLYRWLDDPRFMSANRSARREAFSHAISLTHRYSAMAVQALAKIMTDSVCSASARVSAATAILNFARESIELDDLAERVRALEQSAAPTPIPLPAPEPPTPEAPAEQMRDAA